MRLETKFQDEDFELGEVVIAIINLDIHDKIEVQALKHSGGIVAYRYDSIKDFTDHWEDAPEEPKTYYYISDFGAIREGDIGKYPEDEEDRKRIGNYFETKEEAEKAVEKLKALTRLSKCGFRFEGYTDRDRANGGDIVIYAHVDIPNNNLLEDAQPDMLKDLDLLFCTEDS